MIEVATVASLRDEVRGLRAARGRIAFVPTMGNLHDGHLSLIAEARRRADAVVASIYVNPLQFGPSEDYATYPRTPDADRVALARAGADLLFMPTDDAMYPRGPEAMTKVEVPGVSDILCGAFRPGHFRGVATVVNRLFNLVQPDLAVFGKKDYQQLLVIRLMVADLGLPVDIVGAETVREPDGLALARATAISRHRRGRSRRGCTRCCAASAIAWPRAKRCPRPRRKGRGSCSRRGFASIT